MRGVSFVAKHPSKKTEQKMKTYTLDDIKNYPLYHKEMWEYIVNNYDEGKNVLQLKREWFDKIWKDKERPFYDCFACEASVKVGLDIYCPLTAYGECTIFNETGPLCLDGLYKLQISKKEAELISKLHWKWNVFPTNELKKYRIV